MNKLKILMIIIGTWVISINLSAEDFCVTTSQELYTALFTAGVNNQSDHIKIKEGNYIAPVQKWQYLELVTESFDLKITGGWTQFFDNPCGQNLRGSPLNTTLDGNMQGRVLNISPSTDTKIEISGISFNNGFLDQPGDNGGGVKIESDNDLDHEVIIENCAFIGNNAFGVGGLLIRDTDKAVIRNNLFILNTAVSGRIAMAIDGSNKYGFHITNNTFMFNEGGLQTQGSGTTQTFIANNIFWDNDEKAGTVDLSIVSTGTEYLYNNNIGLRSGGAEFSSGNISVEPTFETGILNFTPSINSPMVGGGKNSPFVVPIPTPFNLAWSIGATDFEGNPRRQGDEIDIGAVESPHQMYVEIPIFKNGFESPE